jgi:hypothetical protein
MSRVYPATRGPLVFNPTPVSMRFRPVYDASGAVIPTMYAARDLETALAESILRDTAGATVPARLNLVSIARLEVAQLVPTRALRLVALHGTGLRSLGLQRSDVIDTTSADYPETAKLAQALHDHQVEPDGLIWTSHQNDSERALILFGDRVVDGDLVLGDPASRMRLDVEPGLTYIRALCLVSNVDFEG